MNISNERAVMVFKDEKGKYTVGVSKKLEDGTYENAYFPIQFNKEVEVENKTKMYIKRAWLSFYKWANEENKGTKFYIKCSEFEIVRDEMPQPIEETQTTGEYDPFKEMGVQVEMDMSDDLPF